MASTAKSRFNAFLVIKYKIIPFSKNKCLWHYSQDNVFTCHTIMMFVDTGSCDQVLCTVTMWCIKMRRTSCLTWTVMKLPDEAVDTNTSHPSVCVTMEPHILQCYQVQFCSTAAAHPCMLQAHNSLNIMCSNLKSLKWPLKRYFETTKYIKY